MSVSLFSLTSRLAHIHTLSLSPSPTVTCSLSCSLERLLCFYSPFDLQAKFSSLPYNVLEGSPPSSSLPDSACWQTSGNVLALCWRSLSGPIETVPQPLQCDKPSYISPTLCTVWKHPPPIISYSPDPLLQS